MFLVVDLVPGRLSCHGGYHGDVVVLVLFLVIALRGSYNDGCLVRGHTCLQVISPLGDVLGC
jgi:hypothetical protein